MADNNGTCLFIENYLFSNRTGNDVGVEPVINDIRFYLSSVVHPALCAFGILGNLLNILVLSRKKFKTSLDCTMELSALCGLISLALSDTLYCISALPKAFFDDYVILFSKINFYMLYQMYGLAFQNIFTQISTWLTVLMAITRYIVICRPLHARYLVETRTTLIAIGSIVAACILLNLPLFWENTYTKLRCHDNNLHLYVLDNGYFNTHYIFKMVFTLLWSIIGFFVPMAILIYCNIHLICALRESARMRDIYSPNQNRTNPGSHITPTLVAVICIFVLLMTPSEILNFYFFTVEPDNAERFTFAIRVTNTMQTLNFSLNFILYCVVNPRFRATVASLLTCKKEKPRQGFQMRSSVRFSADSNTRQTVFRFNQPEVTNILTT